MAIGDSFTAGADVEPGEGFVDLLRPRLGPLVNLGCSWNGPLLELAGLTEYGPLTRPRTILWFFFEVNDLTDLELEMRSPLLRHYLEPTFSQGLAAKPALLATLLKAYVDTRMERTARPMDPSAQPLDYVVYGDRSHDGWRIDWGHVLTLQSLRHSQAVVDYADRQETFDQLHAVLARAIEVARGWGGEIVFIYLPGRQRFSTRLGWIESEAARQRVLRVVASLGLPLVDLTPVFAATGWPPDLFAGHYSIAGNALVAQTVAAALADRGPARAGGN